MYLQLKYVPLMWRVLLNGRPYLVLSRDAKLQQTLVVDDAELYYRVGWEVVVYATKDGKSAAAASRLYREARADDPAAEQIRSGSQKLVLAADDEATHAWIGRTGIVPLAKNEASAEPTGGLKLFNPENMLYVQQSDATADMRRALRAGR